MDPATGAMASLLPKLIELLNEEYKLQGSIKEDVEYLSVEMERMQAALLKLAEDYLDERAKLWAEKVRELSYALEVVVDEFLRTPNLEGFKGLMKNMGSLLTKGKTRYQTIKHIKAQVQIAADLGDRYKIYDIDANAAAVSTTSDIHWRGQFEEVEIFGRKYQELMKLLSYEGNMYDEKLKLVSVVGFAGLGKTTLVKTAYYKIKGEFECTAFVIVGRNAELKKVLREIIVGLSKHESHLDTLDKIQLIEKLQEILWDKRYLIVIDDIWNENLWRDIKYAFPNKYNRPGSRIICTTRKVSVSKACCWSSNDSVFQMEALSDDDSRKLLYERIFCHGCGSSDEFEQVSRDILKKCGGVPLAIITVADLLTSDKQIKPKDAWHVLLKSIGRAPVDNTGWYKMQKILSLSYYDLPSHLKTCLLYVSTFPGGHPIGRDRLVKKSIAEGIVPQELIMEEAASQYLNELVNNNVIQPLECNHNGEVISYHIHPMMHAVLKIIAIEEKFAASLDEKDISRACGTNFRRLSIECPDSENLLYLSSRAFDGGVYSLTIIGHANQFLLGHFKGTRVLDLESRKSIVRADVDYICSMIMLKQLCFAKTPVTELPPQIGNLKYLEGLDVGGTQITELPTQIGKLKHLKTLDARKSQVQEIPTQVLLLTGLVHLLIGDNESSQGVKLPDGIGKMTSLQKLCTIDLRKCSVSSLKELGELPYLKEIAVVSSDEPEDTIMNHVLLSSLDKSTNLRSLVVHSDFRLSTIQSSSAYIHLICLKKLTVQRSLNVPIFIGMQSFLRMLDIRVCKLEEEDLKKLREMPRLQSLIVRLQVPPRTMVHISSEGFAELESLYIDCRMPMVIFGKGAMPKLEHLELKLYPGSASEKYIGMKHLLNLQKVLLRYSKWYATNKGINDTTDALKTEAKEHQNKTTLYIVEENKGGTCTTKTEIFQENTDANCSRVAEIEEDEFKTYHVVANPAAMTSNNPHLAALYTRCEDLVGIVGKKDQEFMNLLSCGDNDMHDRKLKIVSVVGFGGLGKTTLVKTVYNKIKGGFDCYAFVVAGQNTDPKNVLRDIMFGLSMDESHLHGLNITSICESIREVKEFLCNKRYLIVIDDVWNEELWQFIKYAFTNEDNIGSRIITTTRIVSVSKACWLSANDTVYQMEPLSDDDSKRLLYTRIFGSVSRCPQEFDQVSSDILKKCGRIPLAIITMACVLAIHLWTNKKGEWNVLLKSIGHGHEENIEWKDMQKILSFSYYDLPQHLRTCILYLSTFPVTRMIEKDRLAKKLVVEGIVTQELVGSSNEKKVMPSLKLSLEEAAGQYLDELVNRNVIHPLECNKNGEVISYHIHPMMHGVLKAIAIQDKFAASLDDKYISGQHRMSFPHLSIDCPDSENPIDLSKLRIGGGVHSVTIFGHANRFLLRPFKGTQVLDLEGCKSIARADVEYICSMVLLKELCLAKTDITELPPQIGNLQHLEGLDVGGTQITHLPPQICKLKRLRTLDARKSQVKDLPHQVVRLTTLVHLFLGDNESCEGVKVPVGIGKMTSLQQLCTIDLRKMLSILPEGAWKATVSERYCSSVK